MSESIYEGPYWRSNGSITIANQSMEELFYYLGKWQLLKEDRLTTEERYINWKLPIEEDDKMNDFLISFNHIPFASHAKSKSHIIMLMCAIYIEDTINKFLVFNINESIVNSIERMNSLQKMEIATAILNEKGFKGTHVYTGLKFIVDWRNQFAHGKMADMLKQESLRKTHVEHEPAEYPTLKNEIESLIKTIQYTDDVHKYIQKISIHKYTKWGSADLGQLVKNNKQLKKFYERYIKNMRKIDELC
ncbi:hypothetical protein [Metabacillus fastidiosus]|uniref:hypothetical protein n=1 Tax=Metabacillus fastidiosus TaxID=1458 RepID=UPI003D2B2FA1